MDKWLPPFIFLLLSLAFGRGLLHALKAGVVQEGGLMASKSLDPNLRRLLICAKLVLFGLSVSALLVSTLKAVS